ncbi:MAG: hypothetical protein H7122_03150 [Chitinophagaceae bacterium]|nr:hypothetical protein [Chitinophagaceae bacterium]
MLIAFVHNRKAFLPALQGYTQFFSKYNIQITSCTARDLPRLKCDVEWHFMGIDRLNKTDAIKIHDYASASTPPFANLKNKLKTQFNTRPDYRLFPNQFIYKSFGFGDKVPFGFRDVGISQIVSENIPAANKEFDFIYLGEMRSRRLNPLIKCFTKGAISKRNILFLSRDYAKIADALKEYHNIQFKGPVAAGEVNHFIQSSRFGINYIPNIEPFNQQTSTKLLEYAANKIPIVSTRYPWIENFQNKFGGNYFYLNNDLSNFTWEAVNEASYAFPDLDEWTWEHQIRQSGVLEFISTKFPGIRW